MTIDATGMDCEVCGDGIGAGDHVVSLDSHIAQSRETGLVANDGPAIEVVIHVRCLGGYQPDRDRDRVIACRRCDEEFGTVNARTMHVVRQRCPEIDSETGVQSTEQVHALEEAAWTLAGNGVGGRDV